jgi:hypothetical protein
MYKASIGSRMTDTAIYTGMEGMYRQTDRREHEQAAMGRMRIQKERQAGRERVAVDHSTPVSVTLTPNPRGVLPISKVEVLTHSSRRTLRVSLITRLAVLNHNIKGGFYEKFK